MGMKSRKCRRCLELANVLTEVLSVTHDMAERTAVFVTMREGQILTKAEEALRDLMRETETK